MAVVSDVEAELHDVAVLHDVVLALHADLARRPWPRPSSPAATRSSNETISALMKPRWKSVWMTPAACGRGPALVDRPGPRLLGPGGEVGLQPEGVEADPGELVQARLLGARRDSSSSAASSSASSTRSDSSLASRKIASAGATSARSAAVQRLVGQLLLVEVEDVEERLGRQQAQLAQRGRGRPRRPRPRRTACCPPRAPSGRRAALSSSGLVVLLDPRPPSRGAARPSRGSAGRRGSARC